eukprot:1159077-Pelagomonas_calceolata.AAC.3
MSCTSSWYDWLNKSHASDAHPPGSMHTQFGEDARMQLPGRRFDHEDRKRKKEAREVHKRAEVARNSIGLKGKMLTKKRHAEKAQMKKTIAMHEEKDSKRKADDGAPQNAVPAYLLEREQASITQGSVNGTDCIIARKHDMLSMWCACSHCALFTGILAQRRPPAALPRSHGDAAAPSTHLLQSMCMSACVLRKVRAALEMYEMRCKMVCPAAPARWVVDCGTKLPSNAIKHDVLSTTRAIWIVNDESRRCGPRQGAEQHHQAEEEGEGGQVGGALAQGPACGRAGDVQVSAVVLKER